MKSIKSILLSFLLVLFCMLLSSPVFAKEPTIYFFWGEGCPHCSQEKIFLELLKKKYPEVKIKDFEVWRNMENAKLFSKMAAASDIRAVSVPVTFVGTKVFTGFTGYSSVEMEEEVKACIKYGCAEPIEILGRTPLKEIENIIKVPVFGKIDIEKISLPLFTAIIAGMDSFNPCAFFVLFFLLSLLIHAKSKKRTIIVGGIFVFFSGLIYFLFMAAWLNIFLLAGQVTVITTTAAIIALLVSLINIKDFFFFKKGVSLAIPESAKPKLFEKMRNLIKSTSTVSMLSGAVVLAIAANTYELLCTAGFPMIFTRVLTLHNLTAFQYYIYLVFYNIVYVIPLTVIVVIFAITLGAKKLSEWEGRKLKLLSGTMMLGLGLVMLIKPALLNSIFVAAVLFIAALSISAIVLFFTKKIYPAISEI